MKALGYVRRSKEADERTVSLKQQEEAIRGYAAREGHEIVGLITHNGVSGGDGRRYQEILGAAAALGARAVIVYHLDRFGRDTGAVLNALGTFQAAGIELLVVGRGRVSTAQSHELLQTGVEALVAHHHRVLSGEKSRAALAHNRAQGKRYSGRPPLGYRFDGNRVVKDPETYPIRVRLLELLAAGTGIRPAARLVGLSPATVQSIARREVRV